MAKVYLAMYKHKRDLRKEPLKAIADRIRDFLPKANTLIARLLLRVV